MRFREDRPLPPIVSLSKFPTSSCTCFLSCKTRNVIHLYQEAVVGNRCQEHSWLLKCKEGVYLCASIQAKRPNRGGDMAYKMAELAGWREEEPG